jgi:hypothetical protein
MRASGGSYNFSVIPGKRELATVFRSKPSVANVAAGGKSGNQHQPRHADSELDCHERTSIIVTTNLAFGEWPSVYGDAKSLGTREYSM